MVLPAAADAAASAVGKPRRTARWRERPHAVFGPRNFRGVVFTVLQSRDPASAAPLVPIAVKVQVWRDRIKIHRGPHGDRGVTVTFKADPPIGLRDRRSGAILQLRHNGLLWGKHGERAFDRAVMVLWHFEAAETITTTLRPTFAVAQTL